MLEQPDLGDKCTSYTDEFYSVHDKLNSVKCNSTKTGVILEKGLLGNIFHNFHIDCLGKKIKWCTSLMTWASLLWMMIFFLTLPCFLFSVWGVFFLVVNCFVRYCRQSLVVRTTRSWWYMYQLHRRVFQSMTSLTLMNAIVPKQVWFWKRDFWETFFLIFISIVWGKSQLMYISDDISLAAL